MLRPRVVMSALVAMALGGTRVNAVAPPTPTGNYADQAVSFSPGPLPSDPAPSPISPLPPLIDNSYGPGNTVPLKVAGKHSVDPTTGKPIYNHVITNGLMYLGLRQNGNLITDSKLYNKDGQYVADPAFPEDYSTHPDDLRNRGNIGLLYAPDQTYFEPDANSEQQWDPLSDSHPSEGWGFGDAATGLQIGFDLGWVTTQVPARLVDPNSGDYIPDPNTGDAETDPNPNAREPYRSEQVPSIEREQFAMRDYLTASSETDFNKNDFGDTARVTTHLFKNAYDKTLGIYTLPTPYADIEHHFFPTTKDYGLYAIKVTVKPFVYIAQPRYRRSQDWDVNSQNDNYATNWVGDQTGAVVQGISSTFGASPAPLDSLLADDPKYGKNANSQTFNSWTFSDAQDSKYYQVSGPSDIGGVMNLMGPALTSSDTLVWNTWYGAATSQPDLEWIFLNLANVVAYDCAALCSPLSDVCNDDLSALRAKQIAMDKADGTYTSDEDSDLQNDSYAHIPHLLNTGDKREGDPNNPGALQKDKSFASSRNTYGYGVSLAGKAEGDPQFSGFLGQEFQVHGATGATYSIISTPNFAYNALFSFLDKGSCRKGTACFSHPGNYFGAVSLMVRDPATNAVTVVEINAGAVDAGMTVRVSQQGAANSTTLAAAAETLVLGGAEQVSVSHPTAFDVYVEGGEFSLHISNSDMFINQEVALGERAMHNIATYKQLLKAGKADEAAVVEKALPHGILGQTWQYKTYPNRWRYIQGQLFDYVLTAVDAADFKYSRFGQ